MIEIILDRKQIWAICLFEFRMGCKAGEATQNINNSFGPGIANECGDLRSFAKETRALKMRNAMTGYWKLTMAN